MAGNYYYNDIGERVYGYSQKPKNLYEEAPKLPTATDLKDLYKNATVTQPTVSSARIRQQNNALQQQYDMLLQRQKANYDATVKANNAQADEALRETYIANMLSRKNLPQQLKANGISGGATETTLADLQNTYMNNRNAIERQRINANNQARLGYDDKLADAYGDYLTKQTSIVNSANKTTTQKAQTENEKVASMVANLKAQGYSATQIAYVLRQYGYVV